MYLKKLLCTFQIHQFYYYHCYEVYIQYCHIHIISGVENLLHDISDTDIHVGDGASDPQASSSLFSEDVRLHRLGGVWCSTYVTLDLCYGRFR